LKQILKPSQKRKNTGISDILYIYEPYATFLRNNQICYKKDTINGAVRIENIVENVTAFDANTASLSKRSANIFHAAIYPILTHASNT